MEASKEFKCFELEQDGAVVSIRLLPPAVVDAASGPANLHWELAEAISTIRGDDSVRIVVVTGTDDQFLVPRPPESYRSPEGQRSRTEPRGMWTTFTGLVRLHESMAQVEKPIIAKVNGDALGFGSSLVFACDLIVARDDARIIDTHMGMGEQPEVGPAEFGLVPGDGGSALIPLFMTPARAKEYLMLARPYTGKELADLGVINYAVPSDELDAVVDELVSRLLARSAYALAWTKRAANRLVAAQLAASLDAGIGYEMMTFAQWERLGWTDTKSLDG